MWGCQKAATQSTPLWHYTAAIENLTNEDFENDQNRLEKIMIQLDDIVANGFDFNKKFNNDTDVGLAFVSLGTALKAYFSTYQAFKFNLNESNIKEEDYENAYCEACIETIVHFQHFSELICKKILKDKNGWEALYKFKKNDSNANAIKHKFNNGGELTLEEQESLYSIGASDVIKELKCLNKDFDCNFSTHKETCEKLNHLRNSILHKGIFVLRYEALDAFIGKYALPFVTDIINSPDFSSNTYPWKYKALYCSIDPIDEIIKESNSPSPDIGKLAFLKELGRAAYENPLIRCYKQENTSASSLVTTVFESISNPFKIFDDKKRERAEKIANILNKKGYQIENCPVCGVKSLVIYQDKEMDEKTYTYMVKCECCTFELHKWGVKNANDYGFDSITDYWKEIAL